MDQKKVPDMPVLARRGGRGGDSDRLVSGRAERSKHFQEAIACLICMSTDGLYPWDNRRRRRLVTTILMQRRVGGFI